MFGHFCARGFGILGGLLSLALILSCRSRTEEELEKLNLTRQEAERILGELSAKRAEHEPPPEPTASQPHERQAPLPTMAATSPAPSGALEQWLLDDLVDVAPAAPSSATRKGVLVINGQNELFLAKVGPLSASRRPGPSPVAAIPDEKGPFALGRGPTIGGRYAYWITSHYLLRRPHTAPYGPLEIIASDARVGTRASAVTLRSERAAVAYIALPKIKNGPLRARLWFEQDKPSEPLTLTEPGSSTLSVELVEHEGQHLALSLEARMGMTALHARTFDPERQQLASDRVVWIGGTSQPMTEIRALSTTRTLLALLAIEQDISHFGVAILEVPRIDKQQAAVHWTTFANGQDPAPVAAANVCKTDLLLFARPSTASPRAPQELVLAKLDDGIPRHELVLSTARAFYDVSIAALPGGALLNFVADERTWARTLRCP